MRGLGSVRKGLAGAAWVCLVAIYLCAAGSGWASESLLAPTLRTTDSPGEEPKTQNPLNSLNLAPTADVQTFPDANQNAAQTETNAPGEGSLAEAGGSVTVIGKQELAARKAQSVAEVLRDVAGLDVSATGGEGHTTAVYMRGAASGQTLVMINGVEINDPMSPGHEADLAGLTVDNLERIEIRRGPQSVAYGSGAMGGVINLVTRKNIRDWTGTLGLEGGKYSTWLGRLAATGSVQAFDFSLGSSFTGSQGFSAARRLTVPPLPEPDFESDGYRDFTLDATLGYTVNENLKLNLTHRLTEGQADLDAGSGVDALNYVTTFNQATSQLEIDWDLWQKLWQQKLSIGSNSLDRYDTQNAPVAINRDYHGRTLTLDWRNQFRSLVAGLHYVGEQGNYYDDSYPPAFPVHSTGRFAFYLEDEFRWEAAAVAAGVRCERYGQYGSVTTYRVAPVYAIDSTGTRLRAAYGTAFKAPTIYQVYSEYGNTALKPETSEGWEAGVEQSVWTEKLSLGADYFHTDYQNQIEFFSLSLNTGEYRNLGKVGTSGGDIFVSANPWPTLKLKATYTKLTANDLTNVDTIGPQALIRRADYKMAFDAVYHLDGMRMSLNLMRVGPRLDADTNTSYPYTNVVLAPYTLVNLAAGYALNESIETYIKINNLLDADYTEVLGYNTPRFAAFAGINIAWK